MMRIFKNKFLIIGLVIIAIIAISIYFRSNGKSTERITVKKTDVVETVSVSGKTKAVSSATLAFEGSGRIAQVYVDVGDKVKAGDVIAYLDRSTLSASRAQALAGLVSEQARLREIERGTRPEELSIAQTSFGDAEQNLRTVLFDARSSADNIVRGTLDQLFNNAQTAYPSFRPFFPEADVTSDIEDQRVTVESLFEEWSRREKSNPTASTVDLKNKLSFARQVLGQIRILLDMISGPVNDQQYGAESDRTTLSSARTAYSTLLSSIDTAEAKYNTAQENLTLKQKGSTPEEVESQRAKVAQSMAVLESADAELRKYALIAPITGTVTIMDATVGETAQIGVPLVTIISADNLEIEAYVPEVSIGKVEVGNPLSITLDALLGETFSGKVEYIDPGETVLDGVVNYKIKVSIDETHGKIRSGMTANLLIATKTRNAVLGIPRYAVFSHEGDFVVQKEVDGNLVETPVTLGLVGSDGMVEINSGLEEGDVVVVPEAIN